jgi:hypothetical protein
MRMGVCCCCGYINHRYMRITGGGAQHPTISYVILVLIDTERRQLVHSTL